MSSSGLPNEPPLQTLIGYLQQIVIGINGLSTKIGTDISDAVTQLTDLVTQATASVAQLAAIDTTLATVFPLHTLTGSATYNPPSIAPGASVTTTVTVTGAIMGNYAVPSFSLDLAGLTLTAYVSAPNTVTCVFANLTSGAVDLASGTLAVKTFG